mgnify:CR=1 FL=1
MTRQQRRKKEREKNNLQMNGYLFIDNKQNLHNRKLLQDHLNSFYSDGFRISKGLNDHKFKSELMRFILDSKLPNEKTGEVNGGTSMKPNIYKEGQSPIWIIGSLGSVWFDCKTSDGEFHRIHHIEYKKGEGIFMETSLDYEMMRNQVQMFKNFKENYSNGIVMSDFDEDKSIEELVEEMKSRREIGFSYNQINKDSIEVKRDHSSIGSGVWSSVIKRVKNGFQYLDKEVMSSPKFFDDVDFLLWEFELPKSLREPLMNLEIIN